MKNFITQETLYTSADIKREAKAQLKGNWKSAILLSLIPVLFSILFLTRTTSDINNMMDSQPNFGILDIFLEFIHDFLLAGVTFTFMDFLRQREGKLAIEPLRDSVSAFQKKYFSNLFLLKVVKYIYIVLWSLLFVIPGIIKAFGYSQAERIYKDTVDTTGQQPGVRECLKESERLMMGNKGNLFMLNLSFFGWMLLSAFTFGILNIWLTPYMEMSEVIFYQNIGGYHYTDEHYDSEQVNEEDALQADSMKDKYEEVGKDPDDFSDFEDF